LRTARRSALKSRTQAANQLQGLRVTAPEELRHRLGTLSTKELVAVAARYRLAADPSACSGSIFGNGQMFVMRTIEDPTNPLGELVSAQRIIIAVGLDHFALGVYPLGFYGVKPRALFGKKAAHDPHPLCALLDFPVMRSEPAPELFGDVPRGVVPDEHHNPLAPRLELLATPPEKLGGVMELTGLPSTNLIHGWSISGT
jgi:hypothetical protein